MKGFYFYSEYLLKGMIFLLFALTIPQYLFAQSNYKSPLREFLPSQLGTMTRIGIDDNPLTNRSSANYQPKKTGSNPQLILSISLTYGEKAQNWVLQTKFPYQQKEFGDFSKKTLEGHPIHLAYNNKGVAVYATVGQIRLFAALRAQDKVQTKASLLKKKIKESLHDLDWKQMQTAHFPEMDINVTLADMDSLASFLPEKLNHKEHFSSLQKGSPRLVTVVKSYNWNGQVLNSNEDSSKLTLSITDMGAYPERIRKKLSPWSKEKIIHPNDNEYEKEGKYHGFPSYTRYNKDNFSSGSFEILINNRFDVQASGQRMSPEDLKKAIDQIDLNALNHYSENL